MCSWHGQWASMLALQEPGLHNRAPATCSDNWYIFFFVLLPFLLSWGGTSSRWRQRVIVIAMKDWNGRSVGIGRGGSLYFLDWYTELKGYWRFINHVDQTNVNVILSWLCESLSLCAPHSTTLWSLACIGVFPFPSWPLVFLSLLIDLRSVAW